MKQERKLRLFHMRHIAVIVASLGETRARMRLSCCAPTGVICVVISKKNYWIASFVPGVFLSAVSQNVCMLN